jgi:hypothetical protein
MTKVLHGRFQKLHGSRLPFTVREIPDSWWDVVLNGDQWRIRASTLAIHDVDLVVLRNCAYRRGYVRGVFVASKIHSKSGQLYLQARDRNFLPTPTWDQLREAPAMHPLVGTVDDDALLREAGAAVLAALRSVGFQITLPGEQPPAPVAPPPAIPTQRQDNWVEQPMTGDQMLAALQGPQGAGQDEEPVQPGEDPDLAWLKSTCTCGTQDIRFHEDSCALVTGS